MTTRADLRKRKTVQARFWYAPWTIERMAKDVGLENHYEDGYRILSWVEHIDPTHALLRVKAGRIMFDPEFDKKILNESLVMGFSYFRGICGTINELFSLGKGEVLRNLGGRQNSFKRGQRFTAGNGQHIPSNGSISDLIVSQDQQQRFVQGIA